MILNISKKKEFLKNWIDNHQKGNLIANEMIKLYEDSILQEKIISLIPNQHEELKEKVEGRFLIGSQYLFDKVHIVEYSDDFSVHTAQVLSASGSAEGYHEIAAYDVLPIGSGSKWRDQIFDLVLKDKNYGDKISSISNKLFIIWNKLNMEFDETVSIFERYENNLIGSKELGINMRNVVEHLHGRLVDASRSIAKSRYEKLNKKLKWARMADFIVSGGRDSEEFDEFVELHGLHSTLKMELSNLAKNLRDFNKEEVKSLYVNFIEYLNSITLVLDLELIKQYT